MSMTFKLISSLLLPVINYSDGLDRLDMTWTTDREKMGSFIDTFLDMKLIHIYISYAASVRFSSLRLAQADDVDEVWKKTDAIL